MTERQYAVAIDGPSGAGKSTLARAAAEALHILYVDTGAIYRTIGVYMYRHDIAPTDAPAVIAALPEITVALRYDEEGSVPMWPVALSGRLLIVGLVGRYPANCLIRRGPIPYHRSFSH